jgi:hypothetical protein
MAVDIAEWREDNLAAVEWYRDEFAVRHSLPCHYLPFCVPRNTMDAPLLRVQYISDVHAELLDDALADAMPWERIVAPAAPVLALCGDIGRPGSAMLRGLLAWAAARWDAVLVVRGNHDCFGAKRPPQHWRHIPAPPATPDELLAALRADAAAAGAHVHVLERDSVVVRGVTFHGCTLWSAIPPGCEVEAQTTLSDYKYIAVEDAARRRPLRVGDVNAWHARDVAWLRDAVAGTAGPQVVLTHHLPLTRGVLTPPRYRGDRLQCAYSTDGVLEAVVAGGDVRAWLCGHAHVVGAVTEPLPQGGAAVTVAVNAWGYAGEDVPGRSPSAVVGV